MGLVVNALETPLATQARVHCLSDGSRPLTLAELGYNARQAGAWLERLAGRSGTVATLLTASHDCLATLFGALRSGMNLVSLPHPARGRDAEECRAQIGSMCAVTGATHLLCRDQFEKAVQGPVGRLLAPGRRVRVPPPPK